MIPASVSAEVVAYQAVVAASRPISQLTPLQRAALVARGTALVDAIDAALITVGAPLDASDPAGPPPVMIAAIRARLSAGRDQATLSDLRAFVGRAVLNLSRGVA